ALQRGWRLRHRDRRGQSPPLRGQESPRHGLRPRRQPATASSVLKLVARPLPVRRRWSGSALPRVACALLAAMLCATPAWALEVATGQPRERNGLLIVEARFRDLFAPHVAQSIGRGMPATLQLHAE